MNDIAGESRQPLSGNAIHLVRTVVQANQQLSQMADQKANMVMGAAFVVFTLSVAQLRTGVAIIPVLLLATGALFAAIFAMLTVMPSVKAAAPTESERNILFFGVFGGLSEEEFVRRVLHELHTDETVCRAMLRDVHQNGQVLRNKKYRFLGIAYRVFLTGLVLSFVALLIEMAATRIA